jgi:acetyltransferase-like isoleucine patch superfamily enzyme
MQFSGVVGLGAHLASMRSLRRIATMYARGLLSKIWFKSSKGPIFRGYRVNLLNAYFISHTGRLVLEDYVELQGVSSRGIIFGSDVSIGRSTMIRPSSYYGGPAGIGLRIGDRSSIGAGGFIGCSGLIEIGNDVMIGPGTRIFSEDHIFSDLNGSSQLRV